MGPQAGAFGVRVPHEATAHVHLLIPLLTKHYPPPRLNFLIFKRNDFAISDFQYNRGIERVK